MKSVLFERLRGVSRMGTICGVCALLVLATGCDPCMNNPCDDGLACNGLETCTPDGNTPTCGDGTAVVCEAGTACTEPDGTCVDPCEGVDCDDANPCTTDTCVAAEDGTTSCTNEDLGCDDGDACTENDACDPADGSCAGTAIDCDDADACTDDSCADGACVNDPVVCDEGFTCVDGECIEDLCEGVDCDDANACTNDSCDPTDGSCTNAAIECPGEQTCVDGECVDAAPCTTDADCVDDGLFCNGVDVCDTDAGACVSGDLPCDAESEECEEGDTSAVCVPIENPNALNFTLGQDNLNGTSAADSFIAALEFNAGTGTQIATLQNGDSANGLAGTDTLSATYNEPAANLTLTPTLTGIEIWNLTDFGAVGGTATTVSALNSTDVTTVNSVNSSDDAVTVTNLPATCLNIGVTNSASDLLPTWGAGTLNGATDTLTVTLNGAKVGSTITATTPINGFESVDVISNGSANTCDALTQATGTTLATFTCSGDQDLTITGALNTQLTTIDCSTATGATSLVVGGAQNVTYTGGEGDDFINFAGTYTTADTIDGGNETNTLGLNSAQAVAATTAQSNVSNINTVRIVDSLNGNVNVTNFGADDAILDTTAAATALTAGASVVTLGSTTPDATLNNDDTAHTLGLTVSGSGTTDTLSVNLQNADLGNTLTCTGAETVDIASTNGSDGTAADGGANTGTAITLAPTFGTGAINFSGDVALTLTGAITAGTINASAMTAALTMGAVTVAGGGATITGSPAADTLFGSANGDSIDGGNGNDKIVGGTAADSNTGGAGTDTHQYTATTDGGAANADNVGNDLIQDFVVGTGGDILAFQDDIFFNDTDTLDLDIITGAAAGNSVTGLTDGGAAAAQVVVQTTPLTNFAAVATLFTTINGAITSADAIVIAEVTGVGTFVFWDGDTTAADGEQVLAQLVGVTGANLASIVAANTVINDG